MDPRHDDALGDLFEAVAHQLSAPLTAVTGFVGLTIHALDTDATDDAAAHARNAARAGDRLKDQLVRLRQLSALRLGAPEIRFVLAPLGSLVQRAITSAGLDPARVEVDVPEVSVLTDLDCAHRILVEVLTNAAAASARGAPIIIRAGSSTGQVRVEIVDRGLGFAGEPDGHLRPLDGPLLAFRPNGLRLAATYAGYLGAALEVRSASGEGTTVTLRVPAGRSLDASGHRGRSPSLGGQVGP